MEHQHHIVDDGDDDTGDNRRSLLVRLRVKCIKPDCPGVDDVPPEIMAEMRAELLRQRERGTP